MAKCIFKQIAAIQMLGRFYAKDYYHGYTGQGDGERQVYDKHMPDSQDIQCDRNECQLWSKWEIKRAEINPDGTLENAETREVTGCGLINSMAEPINT